MKHFAELKKIVMQKLKAVQTLDDKDFDKAEQMERDMIINQGVQCFDNQPNNIIVEVDREFSKLCAILEMEGIQVANKTVLQFESSIEALMSKTEKSKSSTA